MNVNDLTDLILPFKTMASRLDKDKKVHRFSRPQRFDRVLFQVQSHLLLPYVEELEQSFATLSKLQQQAGAHNEKIAYISERCINQFCAIQREIANQTSQPLERQPNESLAPLYQDRAQHQVWERRLQVKLAQHLQHITQGDGVTEDESHSITHALEQRLHRCRVAKQNIEQQIAILERKRLQ
jgi:primosomal protein N''